MTHRCDTCNQEFDTLTRKRLHDCQGQPAKLHDIPDDLTDMLPDRFLTMDEAAALDEHGTQRFFPILNINGMNPSGKILAGYAKTEDGHFLLAYNGDEGTWYLIEENDATASFEHSENDLTEYVCNHTDVDPFAINGYESGDPEYPMLGQ